MKRGLATATVVIKICLNDKYKIVAYKGDKFLNKRTEIISTCRHRSKYKLANCDTTEILLTDVKPTQ